ncbi:MAG: SPASM domain-containing protein [Desulfobaccales bacterium]
MRPGIRKALGWLAPLRYLTPASALNLGLNRFSRLLHSHHMLGSPRALVIEPTARCNLHCLKCARSNIGREYVRNVGFMSWETFAGAWPFIRKANNVALTGFGEGLLHPEYPRMLAQVRTLNRRCFISSISNGLLLDDRLAGAMIANQLNLLMVSLDGTTHTVNNLTRDGDPREVMSRLKLVKELKQRRGSRLPKVSIDYGANRANLSELVELASRAGELGISYIEIIPTYHFVGSAVDPGLILREDELAAHPLLGQAERKARENNASLIMHRRGPCEFMFEMLYLNWDGNIQFCYMEWKVLGNIMAKSLGEIWNSPALLRARDSFWRGGNAASCPGCEMHQEAGPGVSTRRPDGSRIGGNRV